MNPEKSPAARSVKEFVSFVTFVTFVTLNESVVTLNESVKQLLKLVHQANANDTSVWFFVCACMFDERVKHVQHGYN